MCVCVSVCDGIADVCLLLLCLRLLLLLLLLALELAALDAISFDVADHAVAHLLSMCTNTKMYTTRCEPDVQHQAAIVDAGCLACI